MITEHTKMVTKKGVIRACIKEFIWIKPESIIFKNTFEKVTNTIQWMCGTFTGD